MFSIFSKKTKKTIWEIYQEKGITTDLHCHLLPGIDDGAASVDESLHLLQYFEQVGIRKIILTPHSMGDRYVNPSTTIQKAHQTLNEFYSGNLQLYSSAEYYADYHFLQQLHEKNQIRPISQKYVLFEVSYLNPPDFLEHIIYAIQSTNWIPILAHPERYTFWKMPMYTYLRSLGVFFQLNALSFAGYYGKEVQQKACTLLRSQLADFIGTDLHHQRHADCLLKTLLPDTALLLDYTEFKNQTL